MKAILLDEAKKWLEENCENQYTRMAVFGIMQSMPTVDYQKTPNEPLPVLVNDEQGREYIDYICPRCKGIISQRRRGQRMETVYQCKYHDNCGQRVDWNNSQPYRRPPEGEEEP